MSNIHDKDKQLYTVSDLLSWTPPKQYRIISGGVLNIKNRMLIFGDEGSWKSVLAMHISSCIATGSKWLRFNTSACNVLRLQVEMPMYMDRERIEEFCLWSKKIYIAKSLQQVLSPKQLGEVETRAKAFAYPENMISRSEEYIHIDESSGWESLRRNIINCIDILPPLPLVVVLDPLYKMFNRNLSEETDLKPLIDKIDLIMAEVTDPRLFSNPIPGVSFIIVHHTRKSKVDESGKAVNLGSQDATGARTLLRWVDTALRIDPDPYDETETKIHIKFTKHRNAEGVLPRISLRWDKRSIHPQIVSYITPEYAMGEDELEERNEVDLTELE